MSKEFRADMYLNGISVKVDSRGVVKQKHTSPNRFFNWVLGKIFGTEIDYCIPNGDVINLGNVLYMNPVTFNNLKGAMTEAKYE